MTKYPSPQMDLFESARLREKALVQVEGNAPIIFSVIALDAVRAAAEALDEFTVDAVWRFMPEGAPSAQDNRAMGPVMRRAVAKDWIESTGSFELTQQVLRHRAPVVVWRSKLRVVE